MKAVLLAGGRGKRLRPLTDNIPKCMVPVAGKPIVQWQIEWLRRAGVEAVVLSLGHLAEKVEEAFGDGRGLGIRIEYVVEEEPLGTGGGLRKTLEEASFGNESLFVANGDVLTNLDPNVMERARAARRLVGGIALVPLPSPYGIVEVDSTGLIRSFREKPSIEEHLINAGVYTLTIEVMPYLPRKGSLELEVFPALAREGRLLGHGYKGRFWRSIDSHKDIEEIAREFPELDVALAPGA